MIKRQLNTHIKAIMGHIWWYCDIVVAHSFVDILIMLDQDSLWPHVLLCPSARKETAQPGEDLLKDSTATNSLHLAPVIRNRDIRTCAEERWSRGRGLLSASSRGELQLCGAGHSSGVAVSASWGWLTYWQTPGWTAHKTSVCPHTECSEGMEKDKDY